MNKIDPKVTKHIAKQLLQEKGVRTLIKLLQKLPSDDIDQQVQTFDNSLAQLSKDGHKLKWMTLLDRLIVVSNTLEMKKIMNICLSKVAPEVDECLKQNKTKTRKRAKKLFDHLKCCVTVLMTRQDENMDQKKSGLKDLVASLMSLYLDLGSIISVEETDKDIVGFINYVMKEHGANCLDVLLQQTSDASLPIIVQFARFCLLKPPILKESTQYLKYILCAGKFRDKLPEIFESARNVPAPHGFLDWLWFQNHECVAQMPDDRKFKGREISKFLLYDASEKLNILLLDVLTEDVEGKSLKASEIPYISTEPTIGKRLKKNGAGPSFHVDRKGTKITKKPTIDESLKKNDTEVTFFVDRKRKTKTSKMIEGQTRKEMTQDSVTMLSDDITEDIADVEVYEVDLTQMTSSAVTCSTETEQTVTSVSSSDDDDVQIYEVNLAKSSPAQVKQIVNPSTPNVHGSKKAQEKRSPKKKKLNVSPVSKSSSPIKMNFTTDDEDKINLARSSPDKVKQIVNPSNKDILESKKLSPKKKKQPQNVSLLGKSSSPIKIDFTTDDEDETASFFKVPEKTLLSIFGNKSLSEVDSTKEVEEKAERRHRKRKQNEDFSILEDGTMVEKTVKMSVNADIKISNDSNGLMLNNTSVSNSKCNIDLIDLSSETSDLSEHSSCKVNSILLDDLGDSHDTGSPFIRRQDEETFTPPVSLRTRSIVQSVPDEWLCAESHKQTANRYSPKAGDDKTKVAQKVSKLSPSHSVISPGPNLSPKLDSPKRITLSPSHSKDSTKTKILSPSQSKDSPKTKILSPSQSKDSPKTKILSPSQSKDSPKTKILSPSQSKDSPKTKILSPSQSKEKILSPSQSKDSPKTKILSPSQSKDSPKTKILSPSQSKEKILSPSQSKDLTKTKILSPSQTHDSPKTKFRSPSQNQNSPKTKILSPSQVNDLPKTSVYSPSNIQDSQNKRRSRPSNQYSLKKKTDSQSHSRKSPKKILFNDSEKVELDEDVSVVSRKRTSSDSEVVTYSLRNRRVSASSGLGSGAKPGGTEATPTKKAKVLNIKNDLLENEEDGKPQARRKSSNRSEEKPKYCLRTRTKVEF